MEFEPAGARAKVGACPADDFVVGGEGAGHEAGVDEVDAARGPAPVGVGAVLDFEADVAGDGGGLDGGEVDAGYGCGGEEGGFGECDWPEAGAGADVEDLFDGEGVEGGEVEAAVEVVVEDGVLDVEAFGFGFVVGVDVGSFAVFVVAPAPVHGVVGDGGGEGLGVEVAVVVASMHAVCVGGDSGVGGRGGRVWLGGGSVVCRRA